jgi:hypothetical protein
MQWGISYVSVKILSDVSETVSVSIIKDLCDEDCVYMVLSMNIIKHMRNIIRCDQLQAT